MSALIPGERLPTIEADRVRLRWIEERDVDDAARHRAIYREGLIELNTKGFGKRPRPCRAVGHPLAGRARRGGDQD